MKIMKTLFILALSAAPCLSHAADKDEELKKVIEGFTPVMLENMDKYAEYCKSHKDECEKYKEYSAPAEGNGKSELTDD